MTLDRKEHELAMEFIRGMMAIQNRLQIRLVVNRGVTNYKSWGIELV